MGVNSGYKVNEDGSVTRVTRNDSSGYPNQTPNRKSNNNGGCIWGGIIAFIVIAIVFVIKQNTSNSSYSPEVDSIIKVDTVVADEEATSTPNITTFPKSALSDVCTRRRMDDKYNGYMLIPNFLNHSNIDEDGWMVYSADNGAYITSVIVDYDGSAHQFIQNLVNGLNSTYSVHKANWAVDSGLYGNQIYYIKSVKEGGRIYCAAFFVPKGDKPNAKLYTRLTEKIFSSSNFPTW